MPQITCRFRRRTTSAVSRAPRLTVYRRELYDYAACVNLGTLLHGRFPQLDEIMAGLYFRQKVDRGLHEVEAGRVITHEEARRRVDQWLRR